jgi:4-amino-4-deoxy-L-arabinose transferase-like glycosyltransferase
MGVVFIAISVPLLATLPWEYDEGPAMLGARYVGRGLRPFADFAVHQPPLHLYLLELSGRVFGETVAGYRMLSVASIAASGLLLFWLVRPFTGGLPALLAEAVFLFSPAQLHTLNAVGEGPMLFFCLLAVVLLFLGSGRASAIGAAAAFVAALLVKATCLVMVLAAALSLAHARAWRRLLHFTVAGVVAAILGLVWTFVVSDGIFAEILRYTGQRVGAREAGLWSIDSGFPELLGLLRIETPAQWTVFCFKNFWYFPEYWLPMALFVVGFAGIPVWVWRCARDRPALRAFAILWPVACLLTNFVLLDYVSAKYFAPFLTFTAFLLAGVLSPFARRLGPHAGVAATAIACAALAYQLASSLGRQNDPWYYARADWLARQHAHVVSFTPMFFAATGTEPGCGMWNPGDTYGAFGEAILSSTERTRRFQISDQQLIACLRAQPDARLVIDFWYYFFTRPGSALRAYLQGDGSAQRVFFSEQALAQWEHGRIVIGAGAR